jgi:hypothetical protein
MYISVQRFLQQGSPRPLMVAKFYSKAQKIFKKSYSVFYAVSSAFAFKVYKSANMIQKKTEKLSMKKWQKNGVFDFYYCGQKFSANNFFNKYSQKWNWLASFPISTFLANSQPISNHL